MEAKKYIDIRMELVPEKLSCCNVYYLGGNLGPDWIHWLKQRGLS